jgi:predicted permease
MRSWIADVVTAWKALRATPWTVLAAVVTLGLGIGASTAVLGPVYDAIARPLPFPDAGRLVRLSITYTPTGNTSTTLGLDELMRWRARFTTASGFAGYASETMTARGDGVPQSVHVGIAGGDLFGTLRVPMLAGRAFSDRDAPEAVVVSRAFAERLAGSAPGAVIGRSMTVGGRSWRVGGVAADALGVLDRDVDVWLPARGVAAVPTFGNGDARSYQVVARIAPQVPMGAARDEAARVFAELRRSGGPIADWRVALVPLGDALMGNARPALVAITVAALLLLLAACANVAVLLVNRAIIGTGDLTVRLALGAGRARLLRTAAIESCAIALAGAALGWTATRVFAHALQPVLPSVATVSRTPFAVIAILLALVAALVCGVGPVMAVSHAQPAAALRGTRTTSGHAGQRIRDLLVVAQIAMAVALVAGALLLGRTVLFLLHTDVGIREPDHVLTLRLALTETTSFGVRSPSTFIDDLVRRVRQLPGVVAAGVGSDLPPAVSQLVFTISVITDAGSHTQVFDLVSVTDDYLNAIGADLVRGRWLADTDHVDGRNVAILSESAARHLSPLGDVLGRTLNLRLPSSTGDHVRPDVVGVIRDIRYTGLDAAGRGNLYIPWRQLPMGAGFLVVRTSGDPMALAPAVLRIAHDLDPTLPLAEPHTLDDEIQRSVAPRTTRFAVVGLFAGIALALAVVGLSGALVRGVVERRRDLAIRSAMGATPRRLMALVIVRGLRLAIAGAVVGGGAAAGAGRALASVVFGVSPYDPVTYAVIAIGAVVVALIACYLPARRAMAVDPVELLRSE